MNEDRLIQRLKILKGWKPDGDILSAIKSRLSLSIAGESMPVPEIRRRPAWPLFLSAAVALAVLLFAIEGSAIGGGFQDFYFQARIAFASDAYQKATFALNDAELQLSLFQRARYYSGQQLADLSGAVSETDAYMNGLHLAGEPGKYTAAQCEEAYREYEHYLDDLKAAIGEKIGVAGNRPSQATLSSVLTDVNLYEQAAYARLKLYP